MSVILQRKQVGQFLCVYCGASERCDPIFRDAAVALGKAIGQNGFGLVYGGGRMGLMGLVATSTLEHGGKVIGFIPEHLDEREGAHPDLTELYIVDSMHTRKMNMATHADMFCVLPGGFGTLDELFEIITWRQLNLHQKPICVLNLNGYWDPLKHIINKVVDEKFAQDAHRHIVNFVESVDDAILLAKKLLKDNSDH